jgi:hypothetical protein
MLQVGILVWAREVNPPGLVIADFPHRKGLEEAVFRYRSPEIGFVTRVLEAFDSEALQEGFTGDRLREHEETWLEEFCNDVTAITLTDGKDVDIHSFRVNGKPGTPEQFHQIWDMVKEEQRRKSRTRGTGRGATTRRSSGRKRR